MRRLISALSVLAAAFAAVLVSAAPAQGRPSAASMAHLSPRHHHFMRMRKQMALRGIAAVALAFVVAGCSDSTGPGLTGDFDANVTGDQTKSLEGDAFFSFGSVFGEPETGFAHGSSGVAHALLEVFRRTGDRRWYDEPYRRVNKLASPSALE